MEAAVATKLNVVARDVTGQRKFSVRDMLGNTTVDELVRGLVSRMSLPLEDSTGMPQVYHAFVERDGRHLRSSETVGEALRDQDEIVLHPDVQAGSAAAAIG